ncbi:MAG TPA: thioredoxin family protein, partial [Legionellales bacterium]|nr:thioredoxin family protein [Legionellales bacterium]
ICNHCPFVKHIMPGIVDVARDYLAKDVRFVAISANDVEAYPEDSPANMKLYAQKEQFPFPYLYDATQEVAQSYHAACTPDF